ncbi:hypothetical protein SAMN02745245_00360 [Anaerosphaera aminiphila DSM 21120]|uniref:Uncharacterized protein n=1 Tax=Anaerosphaera aminiphila DSM 21120 TaxID=1120995 RepID=A0A1M5PJV6_9FIRM|nr:hypothetical protein [Anaerosphaera aminiphila]SHH02060.1 hypothetical protein SAMN02745245_00360 [Anaerosphaera aminiphila DSM 21120]
MNETISSNGTFVGYEYRDITVDRDMESVYVDGYKNFGWMLDKTSTPHGGLNNITLKFKRDRKILNKMELTRLQRQFDTCVNEVSSMERTKATNASIVALVVGLIGTAFMAGSTFAVIASNIILCIILAIPGFMGWILPYFLYKSTYAKKTAEVTPLIDNKYDEIYEVCERANRLLEN